MVKRANGIILVLSVFAMIMCGSNIANGKIIYVDDDANGLNNGSSWENAYVYLQDAIHSASKKDEIRVAQGIYTPDIGFEPFSTFPYYEDREPTFYLGADLNDVSLCGGFAGVNSNDPNSRDIEKYKTILSGDLNHDDIDINDSNYNDWYFDISRSDNCWHVVYCRSRNATIDGFTISGGQADETIPQIDSGNKIGGGIINLAHLKILNCEFIANYSFYDGGGIHNSDDLIIRNCTFKYNSASKNGGAIYNSSGNLLDILNSKFINNTSTLNGGAIYNLYDDASLYNCIISGNKANTGGGICNAYSTETLINCTFIGNTAERGNSIGSDRVNNGSISIINCIIQDYDWQWVSGDTIINVSYSNVRDGWIGEGNIDTNPYFVEHIRTNQIEGTENDNLRLAPTSPCVDTGNPSYIQDPNETDIDGNPRIFSDNVDMGAYEFQGEIYVDCNYSSGYNDGSPNRPFHYIQEAIDIAKEKYKVLVLPGVYSKINFIGKAITVTGFHDAPIIDPDYGIGYQLLETSEQDAVTFYSGEDSNSVLKNFIIKNSGLAISLNYGSNPTIQNITFVDNLFGIAAYEDSNPDIRNCIFYNNTNGDLFGCQAWYSCFKDANLYKGNFDADPLFVDAANGDYHLKSEGWRWNESSESWTWDEVTSPCIDAGDPCSPLGDEPMSISRDPNNLFGLNQRINMGAYGGTPQASMPPLGWIPLNNEWYIPQ